MSANLSVHPQSSTAADVVHSPGLPSALFPSALAIGAVLVLAAHAWLIWATLGLTHANANTLRAVASLIVGLGLPAAVALTFAPRLADLSPTRLALGIVFATGLAMRLMWFAVPAPSKMISIATCGMAP